MLKCVLVPNTILIKNEFLVALSAAEHHLIVILVGEPQQRCATLLRIYFLKVCDVNVLSNWFAKHGHLVEHNLLSVGQQLSMETEMSD